MRGKIAAQGHVAAIGGHRGEGRYGHAFACGGLGSILHGRIQGRPRQLGADSKEALRGLAALSLDNQDYDKAFEIYRQLLDAGERSPELLYNAGLICQKRGEPEDAAVLYKEAIKPIRVSARHS